MYHFGWLSERGGNFLNLLQKEGGTQKGGFLKKRGVSTLEETMGLRSLSRKRMVINVYTFVIQILNHKPSNL